jgi:hypothetical protein
VGGGLDLDGAVAAGGAGEFPDRPAGLVFDPALTARAAKDAVGLTWPVPAPGHGTRSRLDVGQPPRLTLASNLCKVLSCLRGCVYVRGMSDEAGRRTAGG